MVAETPGRSGGAVVVLPLRILTMAGPTLPSRFGAVEDCRRLLIRFDVLFEIRRTMPTALEPPAVECNDEFTLGFLERSGSGRGV